MEYTYTWKKGLFSNTYFIYSKDKQIGFIKRSYFLKTTAEIRGNLYSFKHVDFFNRQYDIYDESQKRIIGKIKYNKWFNKARVSSDRNTVYWKYDNICRNKWKIHDARGLKIKYKSSFYKGKITSNTDDNLSLLSGLYLGRNYFIFTVCIIAVILYILYYNSGFEI